MTQAAYSDLILEHYRKEAELHGRDASSTMRDEITRGREVAAILRTYDWLKEKGAKTQRVVDIGCGNGYLLEALRERSADANLVGVEYTPEMCGIARDRNVKDCKIVQGDVRALPMEDASCDLVITERCIINVMDREDQAKSLREVGRVLAPGGHFICLEAFTDGLEQLNEARAELGLEPNTAPYHNMWFDKPWFLETIKSAFDVVELAKERDPSLPPPNFLSSHYFISRAFYPAVSKREVLYNTHLVKFFSFLPPMGNYAAIQFWLLRKR